MSQPPNKKRMAWTAGIAVAAVLGMTGLAFAAVPLYQAFCQITGYGGTTQEAAAAPGQVLDQRIEIRFDANIAPDLPIEFAPKQRSEMLRIGGRAAVAARENLAVGEQAVGHQRAGASDRLRHRLRRLLLEQSAVREVTAYAPDVIDHGGEF